jgi:hypothetical protein
MAIRRTVPNIKSDQPAATRDFFVELGFEVVMDLGWVMTVKLRPTRAAAKSASGLWGCSGCRCARKSADGCALAPRQALIEEHVDGFKRIGGRVGARRHAPPRPARVHGGIGDSVQLLVPGRAST